MKLIVKSPPDYARFECSNGDSTFSLHKSGKTGQDTDTRIYFETERLDETVNALMKNGIVFDELPNDKPWLWREARLSDPDNNQLILYHAGENPKNPPWRIK